MAHATLHIIFTQNNSFTCFPFLYLFTCYEERNKVWNRVLSATKYSLAAVQAAAAKRRSRHPPRAPSSHPSSAGQSKTEARDTRAIKRATRLVLEGAVSKATKVLDKEIKEKTLTDDVIFEKLKQLHPQKPITFNLPSDAPQIACITPTELRSAGRHLAKGASPGPTGITDVIIRILLDDEICCVSFCHMLMDLINGELSKQVMARLRRARLVAIPKSDEHVRPIAVGELILKLAGLILLQRHEGSLEKLFTPIQHGVMLKGGCEQVVHKLHALYKEEYAILSIDLKNAFNSPSRDDIARSVFAFHTLKPFHKFFHAEYAEPSEMLFYGSDGQLFGTVSSTAGVRQGSSLSTLYFCSFLQPLLETLAQEFPELRIYAYIDDVNFASKDAQLLSDAYLRLNQLVSEKHLQMAYNKCVWFTRHSKYCSSGTACIGWCPI